MQQDWWMVCGRKAVPAMEGNAQVTSLDTWNLYAYDPFHVVTY